MRFRKRRYQQIRYAGLIDRLVLQLDQCVQQCLHRWQINMNRWPMYIQITMWSLVILSGFTGCVFLFIHAIK